MESKETSLGKKPYKFVPLTESIEREKFTHHNEYNKNTPQANEELVCGVSFYHIQ